MDKMTTYEAKDIAKNCAYTDRTNREIDRYKLYVAIQSHSKRKINVEDVVKLPWDNKFLDKTEFEYNEAEKKRLDEQAEAIMNSLNSGAISFDTTDIETDMMKSKPNISN